MHLANFRFIQKNLQQVRIVIVISTFVIIGLTLLVSTHAATLVVASESESGLLTTNAQSISDASASGSGAVRFGSTQAQSSQPFVMPSTSVLRNSPKKVFAHYFPPYPISLNNKPPEADYYTVNYLNPEGENGKFRAVGGLLRSRPFPRQPLSGDWPLEDMKTEIRSAIAAGIDGFSVDILGLTGTGMDRTTRLIKAAEQVDPGFKIMLMPDASSLLPATTATQLADALAPLTDSSAVYRLDDNRVVVSPFLAEKGTPEFWQQFMDSMAAKGKPVAFVPLFLNSGFMTQYQAISYGYSNWGSRSPNTNQNLKANIDSAHTQGKIWMQPVSIQDVRPKSMIYAEANNTENLRLTWQSAISGNADWVQLTTWNDYSEATQFAPSSHSQYGYLDMSSYYLAQFKANPAPAITRDALYINHRIQRAADKPVAGSVNTSLMSLRAGSSPARDKVEIVSYLKAPATISVQIGSVTQAPYTAPAGMYTQLFDLAYGTISAQASRNSQIVSTLTSPYSVNQTFQIQDLEYFMTGTDNR